MDDSEKIIICRHCGKPEYWGEMRWLSGWCCCRSCYKAKYQDERHEPYKWNDLDGERPGMEDYIKQKGMDEHEEI